MALSSRDIVRKQYARLKADIANTSKLVQEQKRKTERSMIGWSFNNYELADAPLAVDGMTGYAVAFITNGRKQGQGAGAGTGILAYYNPATNTWLNFRDDTAVLT